MNRIKKILIITTSLVLLVGSYFLWTMVTFDEHAESYIQRDLNKNIRDHQYHKLRKMSNSAAYEWLRKANHVKFTFSSDNQGSGNLYYYAARSITNIIFSSPSKWNHLFQVDSRWLGSPITLTIIRADSIHQTKKLSAANQPQSAHK